MPLLGRDWLNILFPGWQEADALSRLPLKEPTNVESSINSFSTGNEIPLSSVEIGKLSEKDQILIKVKDFILRGWPNQVKDPVIKPFFPKRGELSVEGNCVMVGNRVVIPEVLKSKVLELIHADHVVGLGPGSNVKWKEGVVMKVVSGVTYLVKVEDKVMYKHVNSLRKSFLEEVATYHVPFVPLTVTDSVTPVDNSLVTPNITSPVKPVVLDSNVSIDKSVAEVVSVEPLRRSTRTIKPPQRLDL
ncbi:hypothetical protein PPYR_06199 [Photinus pyralis]|uniref:Uncharacterized protein n=1 Tax=Photinus pyralis TaxID=7054 RepID=A0A5N4AT18_PHOPY|nr:hypothetical protein PPYR_06199 [Photinus pyralis]